MLKKMIIFSFLVLGILAIYPENKTAVKPKIAVILSGCGMMDGSEIYEAAFTVLSLENSNTEIIFAAPDISQTRVVNHLKNDDKTNETRNVLIESARIARGNIKDIKELKPADIDALILIGGIGSITNLSDFMTKGTNGTVNADLENLIKGVYNMKKPIGSMCAASLILAKILGNNRIKITIGKKNDYFDPMIDSFGAIHIDSAQDNIVIDNDNRIVTTPAVMSGFSNSTMFVGIDKMVKQVLKFIKNG
jgi:enhancing lycopene biosynthesis protein 2